MPVVKGGATGGTAPGQLLREQAGVAAFVAGGVGAAHNAVRKGAEGGLDAQQFVTADDLARHAVLAHQRGGFAGGVKRFLVGVVVRNAVFQALVVNAGGGHHVFERGVAVGTQGHQLLHIAFKSGVVALA